MELRGADGGDECGAGADDAAGAARGDVYPLCKSASYGAAGIEKWQLGPLPQIYASQFGWEEMVAEVARVWQTVPPEECGRTGIFAQNFGQAGAIDLFGKKYGLPNALSGHQSYFLWGPRGYTGESMIVIQGRQEQLEKLYASVEKRGHVWHPYSCRGSTGTCFIAGV